MHIAEAVAYEWGVSGGVMKYTYPSDKRPDTSDDVLSLGFISPSFDAVLVRIDSDPKLNNDYLQLEIVSTMRTKVYFILHRSFSREALPLITYSNSGENISKGGTQN